MPFTREPVLFKLFFNTTGSKLPQVLEGIFSKGFVQNSNTKKMKASEQIDKTITKSDPDG